MVMPVLNVYVCVLFPILQSNTFLTKKAFFLIYFYFEKQTNASETCKTLDFTGYQYVFVFKFKKKKERLYTYVSSYFCKPKVLQSFLKGKNV